MKLFRLLAPSLFVFLPLSLHAQLGLYGTFTAAKLNVQNYNDILYGGTFGAYLASGQLAVLSVGIDLRGSVLRNSSTGLDSGLIGPRLGLNTHILPIQPYLEGLVGIGHTTFAGIPSTSSTKFEYQFLGGLDFTIFPRIDWRLVEFSYGGLSALNNQSFHPKSLSTGIVLRLPRILPLP